MLDRLLLLDGRQVGRRRRLGRTGSVRTTARAVVGELARRPRGPGLLRRRRRRCCRRGTHVRASAGTSQHRVRTGTQLARAEGLDEVVVGAGLEAGHDVDLVTEGGDEDQVGVAELAQPLGDGEAVHAGHVDVEGGDQRVVPTDGVDPLESVLGQDGAEAGLAQHEVDEVPDVGVVLDDDGGPVGTFHAREPIAG